MKKLSYLGVIASFFLAVTVVHAGSSYTIGGTTYFSNDDGTTGSMYDIGGTTYFRDSSGNTGSLYNINSTTYYSDSRGTNGSAYDIGGTTYFSDNKGTNGSIYTIGGTTYWKDNKGNSGSGYNIGGVNYLNSTQHPSSEPFYSVPVAPSPTAKRIVPSESGNSLVNYSKLLFDGACKNLRIDQYPNISTVSTDEFGKCMARICPATCPSSTVFNNALSTCLATSSDVAYRKINDTCLALQITKRQQAETLKKTEQQQALITLAQNAIAKVKVYTNQSKKSLVYSFDQNRNSRSFTTKRTTLFFDWGQKSNAQIAGYYVALSKQEVMSNDLNNFTFVTKPNFYATQLRKAGKYNLYVKTLMKDGTTTPVKYILRAEIK